MLTQKISQSKVLPCNKVLTGPIIMCSDMTQISNLCKCNAKYLRLNCILQLGFWYHYSKVSCMKAYICQHDFLPVWIPMQIFTQKCFVRKFTFVSLFDNTNSCFHIPIFKRKKQQNPALMLLYDIIIESHESHKCNNQDSKIFQNLIFGEISKGVIAILTMKYL